MRHNPRVATRSVLIVGSSRGIGAGLVRRYVADGWSVHATVRDLAAPGELIELADRVTLQKLDVRDPDATDRLASRLTADPIDVFIHNAGIYRGHPDHELMEVNAVAPIRTTEALLEAGAMKRGGVVALMTSQLGARRGGPGPSSGYGASKAALNDEFRARADTWSDAAGIIAIVIHPGWVRTDMGGQGAAITVEESVDGIVSLINRITPDHHGRFWTWEGREHPW